jgi:hypothetical protein
MLFPQNGDKEVDFNGFVSFGDDDTIFGIFISGPLLKLVNEDT